MVVKKTASRAILDGLSAEQRRVFAAWRALIILRRATFTLDVDQRRWTHLPENIFALLPLLRQMEQREEIARIPPLARVYEVTVPYAVTGPLDEFAILMEVHPFAALSHASALTFHGLSNDLEKQIMVIVSSEGQGNSYPAGTTVEDWEGLPRIVGTRVARILDRSIHWGVVQPTRFFGVTEYHRFGYPLRVTDRERTVLDGLREPEHCGGLDNVLRAWIASRDVLNIEAIIEYVDRFDIAVLRQRVGFVMESLGLAHPQLESWRKMAQRGGSSKLLGSAPYSSSSGTASFSEQWNLALNAPIDVLQEAR